MKLKELVASLQPVCAFDAPDISLEQFFTGADLAAQVLYTLEGRFGALCGRHVADLGTGTGVLAIGAALLGAAHVCAFDIDAAALASAAASAEVVGVEDAISWVRCDVLSEEGLPVRRRGLQAPISEAPSPPSEAPLPPSEARLPPSAHLFDTVVMNPPFGTRRPGADVGFLRAALALLAPGGAAFSMHKSSTRAHLVRLAVSGALSGGAPIGVELVAQLRFELPATYAFHRAESVDVDVDLLRFVLPGRGADAEGEVRGTDEAARLIACVDAVPKWVPAGEALAGRGGGRRA